MTSMDREVLGALFRSLHQAEQGKAGYFGVTGTAPNGVSDSIVVAIDSVLWDRTVKPALDLIGVECVECVDVKVTP